MTAEWNEETMRLVNRIEPGFASSISRSGPSIGMKERPIIFSAPMVLAILAGLGDNFSEA